MIWVTAASRLYDEGEVEQPHDPSSSESDESEVEQPTPQPDDDGHLDRVPTSNETESPSAPPSASPLTPGRRYQRSNHLEKGRAHQHREEMQGEGKPF